MLTQAAAEYNRKTHPHNLTRSGFKLWLCHLLAARPQAHNLTSQSLSGFICKMERRPFTVKGCVCRVLRIQGDAIHEKRPAHGSEGTRQLLILSASLELPEDGRGCLSQEAGLGLWTRANAAEATVWVGRQGLGELSEGKAHKNPRQTVYSNFWVLQLFLVAVSPFLSLCSRGKYHKITLFILESSCYMT